MDSQSSRFTNLLYVSDFIHKNKNQHAVLIWKKMIAFFPT
jgi:hypothetical protein